MLIPTIVSIAKLQFDWIGHVESTDEGPVDIITGFRHPLQLGRRGKTPTLAPLTAISPLSSCRRC